MDTKTVYGERRVCTGKAFEKSVCLEIDFSSGRSASIVCVCMFFKKKRNGDLLFMYSV